MNKILIVEDEVPISNLIKENLNDAGYLCFCAFDGMQAADMVERERYDLVLLDIMLPEIDGYELLEYIKPLGIPVIFLTAKGDVHDKVKGLKSGSAHCQRIRPAAFVRAEPEYRPVPGLPL